MFVGKRNTMFTEYTENIIFPCTFLEKSSFAFRLEKVSYISIFSRLYICMFVCIYIYIYIYIYVYMYNAVCIMKLYEYINNETTPYYVSNIMIFANLALK